MHAQQYGWRARWAAIGAALAISVGAIGAMKISAAPSSDPATFVPITPCRLLDTRSGADNVGTRATPLGPDETHVATVRGTNGECTIPESATGVSMNVTVTNPTGNSFLTVFPADVTMPTASNLNWVAGQPPTPNAVTGPLSADGKLGIYNLSGTVDVIVDIVGYYQPLPADAYEFEGTAPIALVNSAFTLLGDNSLPSPFAQFPRLSWMAPRDCTMSGTVRVLGLATSSQFALFVTAFDDGGAFRNSDVLVYDNTTASGLDRALPSFDVTKGERVVFSEIANVGLALSPNTTAYFSLQCV